MQFLTLNQEGRKYTDTLQCTLPRLQLNPCPRLPLYKVWGRFKLSSQETSVQSAEYSPTPWLFQAPRKTRREVLYTPTAWAIQGQGLKLDYSIWPRFWVFGRPHEHKKQRKQMKLHLRLPPTPATQLSARQGLREWGPPRGREEVNLKTVETVMARFCFVLIWSWKSNMHLLRFDLAVTFRP